MNDVLNTLLQSISQSEQQLIPVFIHNPNSQRIAGVVYLGEQIVFGLLSQLHPSVAAAVRPVPALASDLNPLAGAD